MAPSADLLGFFSPPPTHCACLDFSSFRLSVARPFLHLTPVRPVHKLGFPSIHRTVSWQLNEAVLCRLAFVGVCEECPRETKVKLGKPLDLNFRHNSLRVASP